MLAVLDTNVLFPAQLRHVLLEAADHGLFDPLWSPAILEELKRKLASETRMSREQRTGLFAALRDAFPEASEADPQGVGLGFDLPDETDRPVMTLAVHYQADVIVTLNTRHFPAELELMHQVRALPPAEFFGELVANPDGVLRAADSHWRNLSMSTPTRTDYLESLRVYAGLPGLADWLALNGFLG